MGAVEGFVHVAASHERQQEREWKLASKKELEYIDWNNTWTQLLLPPHKDIIQCKVV